MDATSQTTERSRGLAFVYAATIFVSAFLLFQIQPMISKAILPWFGGTPAVWTVCLLFFQSLLFAGYAYAHFTNHSLRPRQQAGVHILVIIIALGLALLGVVPGENLKPAGEVDPTRAILLILAASIGLPYFVLSATGPLLQAWFARAFPGRTPYRLYALSNIGSLLALGSCPFFFEPNFNLSHQAFLWTCGFAIYAALCVCIAWRILSSSPPVGPSNRKSAQDEGPLEQSNLTDGEISSTQPNVSLYTFWVVLAAFASVVLIATTNHISIDIAVMPLLWVVPLALYLLTFIIAFDRPGWYRRVPVVIFAIVSIYAAAATHHFGIGSSTLYEVGSVGRVLGYLGNSDLSMHEFKLSTVHFLLANFATVFSVGLLCHGEI